MEHKGNLVSVADDFPDKVYRFGIDDNIWVFRDLARERPASLFDNRYLKNLQLLHEKYGTLFVLNVFYETEGFALSQMPDCYREEWEANASWLRLAFHSQNEPRSYALSSYEEVYRECEEVHRQIRRFAGEKTLSLYTTIHFTSMAYEGCRALRDCGIKGLICSAPGDYDNIRCSYYLNQEQTVFMDQNSTVLDTETGLLFLRNDITINRGKLEDIVPILDGVLAGAKKDHFMAILLHEQYFYSYYPAYLPDYTKRMEVAIQWMLAHGYRSIFLEEYLKQH